MYPTRVGAIAAVRHADDNCPIRGQLMKVRPVSKAGGIITLWMNGSVGFETLVFESRNV